MVVLKEGTAERINMIVGSAERLSEISTECYILLEEAFGSDSMTLGQPLMSAGLRNNVCVLCSKQFKTEWRIKGWPSELSIEHNL